MQDADDPYDIAARGIIDAVRAACAGEYRSATVAIDGPNARVQDQQIPDFLEIIEIIACRLQAEVFETINSDIVEIGLGPGPEANFSQALCAASP